MPPRMTMGLSVSYGRRDYGVCTVHEDVRVVASYDVVHTERGSTAVQGLSAENTAERAVVFLPNCRNDAVHCPSVQLIIGKDLEGHVVLLLIALDGLMIEVNTMWLKKGKKTVR